MPMPISGCISLKYCLDNCDCSSISWAVEEDITGNKSLSELSDYAGCSPPHCMREFLGYPSTTTTTTAAPTMVEVTWCQPTDLGGDTSIDGNPCYCTGSVGWTPYTGVVTINVPVGENTGISVDFRTSSTGGSGEICAIDCTGSIIRTQSNGGDNSFTISMVNVNSSVDYCYCGDYS